MGPGIAFNLSVTCSCILQVEAMLERSAGEGPEGFYPKPLEDYGEEEEEELNPFSDETTKQCFNILDYPWAGSLKPVSNELFKREYQQRTRKCDKATFERIT
jgi:hypothetical protein